MINGTATSQIVVDEPNIFQVKMAICLHYNVDAYKVIIYSDIAEVLDELSGLEECFDVDILGEGVQCYTSTIQTILIYT